MTFDLCNLTSPILIKKNLIKCIYKVVNVSKSQYYEFRHNIMNLGNQNSKYSWRIRDLENPQTGTQFANSVLMYKMYSDRHLASITVWSYMINYRAFNCDGNILRKIRKAELKCTLIFFFFFLALKARVPQSLCVHWWSGRVLEWVCVWLLDGGLGWITIFDS